MVNFDDLDAKKYILIKGARQHNLQNVDVAIPRKKLVVVTGVSGSGKSSLTIDTLYAEGQRRYVESLSSYARQFMSRMDKPDVDYIRGICPAIAIEQKVSTQNARSTVGTLTEIYDYLRIMFARIGHTISPVSGKEVRKDSVTTLVNTISKLKNGSKLMVLIPFKKFDERDFKQELEITLQKGYNRVWQNGQLSKIEDCITEEGVTQLSEKEDLFVLIDRLVVKTEDAVEKDAFEQRLADSANLAFSESMGDCYIQLLEGEQEMFHFSNKFELDGILFEEPSPQFFNFNNPYGACKKCEGFGQTIGVDEDLVIPNKSISVYEDAIAPWKGEKMQQWKNDLVKNAHKVDFPIHRPISELSDEQYDLLWEGNKDFEGIYDFFNYLESNSYKMHYRVMMARYRGRTRCPECKGARLRKDALYVKIAEKHIGNLVQMPISELKPFFDTLKLNETEAKIAKRLLIEVNNRLQFMLDVGLGYLSLNRLSSTLSGGETQRINLTRTLGSNLTSSMYILDEPSIGLHPRDTSRLIKVLKNLRDLGNTVIVVEHEEDIIRAADHIIDVGEFAGRLGGEIIFNDVAAKIETDENSLTGKYLSGRMEVPVPKNRRKPKNKIQLTGANLHNLKNIDVEIPLQAITVVTGVSGSGKTTLIKDVFFPALDSKTKELGRPPKNFTALSGDVKRVSSVEMIGQHPLGRSSRSNPVTYVKAYDAIRKLYSEQKLSQIRNYQPKTFSFNVEAGRCEACAGEGVVTVEMQFLADVKLKCEDCNGQRFKPEVLEVKYKGKHITDVLEMTVDEAIIFFEDHKDISGKLQPLADVGLGYVQLGQSTGTLSGGEAQRVKLASFLGKGSRIEPILFIFDEPTTGLHFHDIHKLMKAFNALVENGHSVVVIEHNLDVIKCADWIIDLGAEGGKAGGNLVFQGTPEKIIECENSYTGHFLKEKMT